MAKHAPAFLGLEKPIPVSFGDAVQLLLAKEKAQEECQCICHKINNASKKEINGKKYFVVGGGSIQHKFPCCRICPKCRRRIAIAAFKRHVGKCDGD